MAPTVAGSSVLFFCDSAISDADQELPRHFLDSCCRCKSRLHVGDDVYMYKGDTPFCSDHCRQLQILIDEVEETRKNKMKRSSTINGSTNKSCAIRVRAAVAATVAG